MTKRFYKTIEEALYAAKENLRDGFKIKIDLMYEDDAKENDQYSGVMVESWCNNDAPSNR